MLCLMPSSCYRGLQAAETRTGQHNPVTHSARDDNFPDDKGCHKCEKHSAQGLPAHFVSNLSWLKVSWSCEPPVGTWKSVLENGRQPNLATANSVASRIHFWSSPTKMQVPPYSPSLSDCLHRGSPYYPHSDSQSAYRGMTLTMFLPGAGMLPPSSCLHRTCAQSISRCAHGVEYGVPDHTCLVAQGRVTGAPRQWPLALTQDPLQGLVAAKTAACSQATSGVAHATGWV